MELLFNCHFDLFVISREIYPIVLHPSESRLELLRNGAVATIGTQPCSWGLSQGVIVIALGWLAARPHQYEVHGPGSNLFRLYTCNVGASKIQLAGCSTIWYSNARAATLLTVYLLPWWKGIHDIIWEIKYQKVLHVIFISKFKYHITSRR